MRIKLIPMIFRNHKATQAISKKKAKLFITRTLWSILKKKGFKTFTKTTAWRHKKCRVDVVTAQFFPISKTQKWAIEKSSFGIYAGSYFDFIPSIYSPFINRSNASNPLPRDTECPIRFSLYRQSRLSSKTPRNLWFIDDTEESLREAHEDIVSAINQELLPWFDRWDSLESVLALLETEEEKENNYGKTWGFGGLKSPVRHCLAGFVALELGDYTTALNHLNIALTKGSLADISGNANIINEIESAIEKAKASRNKPV